MAFFKFRKGGDEHPTPPPAPESVEAMRKRARHRLIGAAVLVLVGVVGFPLLFDNQPRPIAVDIPIEIPDKNKAKPLGNAPVVAGTKSSGMIEEGPAPAASAPAARAAAAAVATAPAPKVVAPEVAKPAAKVEAKPETKPAEKPAEKVVEKSTAKADEAAKAQALLEGRDADKKPAAAAGRFVVQVGAFADVLKAREARVKLEKAGMKTYTQVVQSKDGRRIRVRVGPFESKAEADKAGEKIKKLDLPAATLEL
jgi:DedD protein